MDGEKIIKELCEYPHEREWFEFKSNWFQPEALGEYVSALSNAAALSGRKYGYFVWGIDDETHEIIGTDFDQYQDYKKEPYQNFLNRNLSPHIRIEFNDFDIDDKKVVMLSIECANDVPTSFKGERFARIGSSKVNLKDYPKLEKSLFKVLEHGYPTILNTPAIYQDLTFEKLFMYYGAKGVELRRETFINNLNLKTNDGRFNMLAQLLSDDSHTPLRVSIFEGKTKASNLYSVKDFGFDCILYSLKNLLDYGDVLNFVRSDETNRKEERNDQTLFDIKSYNEAIVNAVLHNKWVEGNEPMISVFSDRIEILSRGNLAPYQTIDGFFLGESVPVNEKLSEIFAQLRISDKSGRGVPKIVSNYGRNAFEFRENSIVVTIPFRKAINGNDSHADNETIGNNLFHSDKFKSLNPTRKAIISEMRNNPNITKTQLISVLKMSDTAIDKNIKYLKDNGYIERAGNKRTGYWKVID